MLKTLLITHFIVVLVIFLIIGGLRLLDVATRDPYKTGRLHASAGCGFLGLALIVVLSCVFLAARYIAVG